MKYQVILIVLLSSVHTFFAQVLDNNFGVNGKFVYDINPNSNIEKIGSMIAVSNDKILVGGTDNTNAYLVRHNSDGSFDTSFQANGIKQLPFKSIEKILKTSNNEIIILGTKLATDGYFNIIVCKVDENGNYITNFGTNGILEINFGAQSDDNVFNGELQSDGKIIIVGNKRGTNAFTEGYVLRLLPNGQFDTSFNNTGLFTIAPVNHRHYLNAVSIAPNGTIVCSGYLLMTVGSNQGRMFILRLLPNGTLDTSFSNIGYTYFTITNQSTSLSNTNIVLSDGSILLGGESFSPNNNNVSYNFTVVKFNVNGSFANSFGTNGIVQTLLPSIGGQLRSMKLDSSNNIIAVGSTYSATNGNENFAMMKYNLSGVLDTQFGNSGVVITDFSGFQDIPFSSIIYDSKIILSGLASSSDYPGNSKFAIAQYTYNNNLGVFETKNSNDFKIFPTVFSDNVNIKCKKETTLNIDIVDSSGKRVDAKENFKCSQNNGQLQLPMTEQGIYWIRINSGDKVSVQKLIKK